MKHSCLHFGGNVVGTLAGSVHFAILKKILRDADEILKSEFRLRIDDSTLEVVGLVDWIGGDLRSPSAYS